MRGARSRRGIALAVLDRRFREAHGRSRRNGVLESLSHFPGAATAPRERAAPPAAGRKALADPHEIPIKIPDEILRGVYANQMMVTHTGEEFLLDFINLFPPGGVVNARIIVSPGHLKRMIRALQESLHRYEAQFGPVDEAAPPQSGAFNN